MKRSDGTIEVFNPSRSFKKDCSQVRLRVPDSNSFAYISKQQLDWALRAWSETNRYLRDGGKVIFVTFTYAPHHLPKYKYVDDNGQSRQFACFSKNDCTRFLNSYRKFFERLGVTGAKTIKKVVKVQTGFVPYIDSLGRKRIKKTYDSKVIREEINKDRLPIRYMWNSEFGESDDYVDIHGNIRVGTKAPHYHTLLFLPREAVDAVEKGLGWTRQSYKDHIQSLWPYGMCRWSKPNIGFFVTSDAAVRYTTKYCCKQIEFYNNKDLQDYLLDGDGKVIKSRKDSIKDCLPYHHQSKSFGSDLVNDFDTDEKVLEGVDFHLACDVQKGKRVMSSCPTYIKRKLYMKFDPYGQYRYTEKGLRYKAKEYFKRKSDTEDMYRALFSGTDGVDYEKYVNMLSLNQFHGMKWNEIRKYITGILVNYGISSSEIPTYLSLYDMVYNGMYISMDSIYHDIDSYDLNTIENDAYRIYMARLNIHHNNCDAYCPDGYLKSLTKVELSRFKTDVIEKVSEKFAELSKISQICRELRFYHRKDIYDAYVEDSRKRKIVKHTLTA